MPSRPSVKVTTFPKDDQKTTDAFARELQQLGPLVRAQLSKQYTLIAGVNLVEPPVKAPNGCWLLECDTSACYFVPMGMANGKYQIWASTGCKARFVFV